MKKGKHSTYQYLVWTAVAVVLLYFSFEGVKWADFLDVLKSCRWGWVLLSMAAGLGAFIIRALRWRLLLKPMNPDIKRIDCYDGFAIGKFTDTFLPHVGEFIRCGYVCRAPLSYDKALATVVVERSWDIFTLLLIIILTLSFGWQRFGAFAVEKIWTPVGQSLNFSLWWIVAGAGLAAVAAVIIIFRLRERNAVCGKIAHFFSGMWQGALACLRMKGKGLFMLYTLVLWAMFLMMSLFIIWALPDSFGLGWVDALFLMLVGSVAGIVPVPGGFGAFHYMVALALSALYGVPWEMGIVFATLSHESQAVMTVVCGAAAYVHQSFFRNKIV